MKKHFKLMAAMLSVTLVLTSCIGSFNLTNKVKSWNEGLGNKFLGNIREVDAVVHVVRCFENNDIVHVEGSVDPIRDVETINLELILSDLEIVERAIDRTTKAARADKKLLEKLAVLEKVKACLEEGKSARSIECDDEEKAYVSDFKTAEEIVKGLKKKNSNNLDDITIEEKYETELVGFTTSEKAIAKLYEKKIVKPKVVTYRYKTTGSANTSRNMSNRKTSLGVSLIRPITGIITSRFGHSSRIRSGAHTGLDIAASTGTSIKAAAGGTVTFSGWKGSLGYMVVVSHGNGVQTYYAHCSKLYVTAGQKVKQGQKIAAVGSTGNSTGSHLHLEVRVNGVAYNPQNYVY